MRKLEKAKIAPPPDWLEDHAQVQKMFCDLIVGITNTGQSNPPKCAAVSVLLVAREGAHSISAPNVMWACVWCLVSQSITPNKLVNGPNFDTVCCDKTVIQGATDLLQQPELCE